MLGAQVPKDLVGVAEIVMHDNPAVDKAAQGDQGEHGHSSAKRGQSSGDPDRTLRPLRDFQVRVDRS